MSYLIFSDAHVEPGDKLSRFNWLGQQLVEHRPDTLVQLGDFVSMLSLSHWDMNKRLLMEGRRFNDDIVVGLNAWEGVIHSLRQLQEIQRKNKVKIYKPRLIWCEGNHEEWIQRYIEQHPEMKSYLHPFPHYIAYSWELFSDVIVVDYKDYHIENDIAFTHAPIMGNSNPIGGKYVNERALDLFHTHIVFGHTHRFLHSHRYLHGKGIKQAVNCGCFFEKTPAYAKGAANEHFRCCVHLFIKEDGTLDIATNSWR